MGTVDFRFEITRNEKTEILSKSNNCGTLKLLKRQSFFFLKCGDSEKQAEETRSLERDFLIPAELRTQSFFSKEEES